jgi:predicted secreted protein
MHVVDLSLDSHLSSPPTRARQQGYGADAKERRLVKRSFWQNRGHVGRTVARTQ